MTTFSQLPIFDILPIIDRNMNNQHISQLLLTSKNTRDSLISRGWHETVSKAEKLGVIIRFLLRNLHQDPHKEYQKIVVIFYDDKSNFISNIVRSENTCYFKKNDVYLSEVYPIHSLDQVNHFVNTFENRNVSYYKIITFNAQMDFLSKIKMKLKSVLCELPN